ncbi:acyltransferase [Pseudonocardia xinjiangensis]|uniref:Acyltransferase n=1 Tax=Pseudonocardia xinjiangensis TaxID=75289 RepID=A0ABX1RKC2_9PSEU|nr:acyltransferase [Pseudonocardia xinjiangensis]NMH79688.1 acyltransferase [Pseudonocardia xinjiangensis]
MTAGAHLETQRRTARSVHIYPADMVRVLTFACVIGVHTISTVNPLDSVPGGAVVMLLHFTREAFFVLTAFVLTHRYRDDPVHPVAFWRRRFLLVGVPYLVWSVIYTGLGLVTAPLPAGQAATMLLHNVLTGMAWFHLYFLLVSLQFYLVFPLFRRLLRATTGWHAVLLAVSAVLQVLIDLYLHDPAPTGMKAQLLPYAGSFLVSYQFFLVLGGVVALHATRVDGWIRRHVAVVVAAVLLTGALAEGRYQWGVAHGVGAQFATDVFQPVMVLWSVAVVAAFYAVGAAWADRRAGGPASRAVEGASDRSFGVFLLHPTILWALTVAGPTSPAARLPAPWSSFAVYAVAVVASLAIVEVVQRTPLSLALTGKSRTGKARPVAPGRARHAPPAAAGGPGTRGGTDKADTGQRAFRTQDA